MYSILIIMSIMFIFLIILNITFNIYKTKNYLSIINIFLMFYFLNVIDIFIAFRNGNIYLKLNSVSLETPFISTFIALFLNIILMISLLFFNTRKKVKNMYYIKNNTKKINSLKYIIAVVPATCICLKLLGYIIKYGLSEYIYSYRSGVWVLIAIVYSIIAFSIIRSTYLNKVDIVNFFAIILYFVAYGAGGAVIIQGVVCAYIYDQYVRKIELRKIIVVAICLIVFYPLTKYARSTNSFDILSAFSSMNFETIFRTVTSRSHGFSIQIAIIDYCNSGRLDLTFLGDFIKYVFMVLIPRSIFPNKPNILGFELTKIFTYNQFVVGTSLAPSIIGYLYHAVGFLSAIVLVFISNILVRIDRINENSKYYYIKPFLLQLFIDLVDGNIDGYLFNLYTMVFWGAFWMVLIIGRKRKRRYYLEQRRKILKKYS